MVDAPSRRRLANRGRRGPVRFRPSATSGRRGDPRRCRAPPPRTCLRALQRMLAYAGKPPSPSANCTRKSGWPWVPGLVPQLRWPRICAHLVDPNLKRPLDRRPHLATRLQHGHPMRTWLTLAATSVVTAGTSAWGWNQYVAGTWTSSTSWSGGPDLDAAGRLDALEEAWEDTPGESGSCATWCGADGTDA